MDAVPHETPDDAFREDLDAAVGDAVGRLRRGWVVLRNCVLLEDDARRPPTRIGYALLHPDVGVALLDVAPDKKPDAAAHLRRRLDMAGFSTAFPGYLPVVYRSLPASDLWRVGDVFDEAFGVEGAIDLPGGAAWMDPVRQALVPPDPPEPPGAAMAADRRVPGGGGERRGTRRPPPPCPPYSAARRVSGTGPRALVWSWALVLLTFGGGVALLHHLGPPDGLLSVVGMGDRTAAGSGEDAATPIVAALGADGPAGDPEHWAASSPYAAVPSAAATAVGAGWPPPAGNSVPVARPEPEDSAAPARQVPAPPEEEKSVEAASLPATAVAGLVDRPGTAADRATPTTGPSAAGAGTGAWAAEDGAPGAGPIGERPPSARGALPDSGPASPPNTPNGNGAEAAPAPADADRLSAEIATLQRRLEALEGGTTGSGGAADGGTTGGVPDDPAAVAAGPVTAAPAAGANDAAGGAEPAPAIPPAVLEAVAPIAEPPPPVAAPLGDDPAYTPPPARAVRSASPSGLAPANGKAAEAAAATKPVVPAPTASTAAAVAAPGATPANGEAEDAAPAPRAGDPAPAAPLHAATLSVASPQPSDSVEAPGPPPPTVHAAADATGHHLGAAQAPAVRGAETPNSGPPAARDVAPAPSPALVAALIARGDALVARRDISAARLLYERAATGNARAAAALAKTYDPEFLAGMGPRTILGDATLAAAWYRKAASLGDADALARAEALSGSNREAAQRRP